MYITKNSFLVVGVSRSGVAAADFILALGGICYLCDEQKTDGILMSVSKLTEKGAIWVEMNEVEAMLSKIDVVVLSPGVPTDNSIPVTAKRMGKRIIGEMELGYMFSVNPIIAVTGTNGKTTTCSMIAAMLDKAGVKNELLGNIGVPYTSKISNMDYNTVAVTEVSSFQLETLSSFTPHIAVITNITEDHLSRHYNMQNYVYLKNKLIVNQRESEYSVLNYDDYIVRSFADKAKSKVVFFSTKQKVDGVYIDDDLIYYYDTPIMDKRLIGLKGEHNLYNILAMIAVGKLLNLSENIIAEAAIEFKGIKHRIEYVKTVNDIEFYNDSKATNTDSTVKALSSMVKPTVLILGGKDKGQCFDGLFEECKKKEVARIVLYGEARYKLLKCAEKLEVRGVCLATNLYSATALAYAEAQKGQSVLFSPACSSFDEFSCFEERGERFIEYVNSFS